MRADASDALGTGHVMRCLTLADAAARRGAEVWFASAAMPAHLADRVRAAGHRLAAIDARTQQADASAVLRALDGRACSWVVVDNYALGATWERAMRASGARVMAIDDLANRDHDADVLLDQNVYIDMEERYAGRVSPSCRLLLGPRYALLRDEFLQARASTSIRGGTVSRVLVFLGGVDARNDTARAIDALAAIGRPDLHVDVVIGAGHPHRAGIETACARHGFVCHVQTDRMAALAAAADLGIGAGGSASWERCCVGLPTLAVCIAANQRHIDDGARLGLFYTPAANGAEAPDLRVHLHALLDNPNLLHMYSRNGWRAVDGRGTHRVLRALGLGVVSVRPATSADARMAFEWRNHSRVREVSHQPEPLDWAAHEAWFARAVDDPDRVLLIGERRGEPVGVVRFDIEGGTAEVSIYTAPARIGDGLGPDLLAAAEAWLEAHRPDVTGYTADVLGDNTASHGLFRTVGYHVHATVYQKPVHR